MVPIATLVAIFIGNSVLTCGIGAIDDSAHAQCCAVGSSMAQPFEIPLHSLGNLRSLYHQNIETHSVGYLMMDNFYRWLPFVQADEMQIFTHDNNWMETGAVIIRDKSELFFDSIRLVTPTFEKVLEFVIRRQGPVRFSMVYSDRFRTMVQEIMASLALEVQHDTRMIDYRYTGSCCSVYPEDLPFGYRYGRLSTAHVQEINQHWTHSDPVFNNLIDRLVQRNPSVAIFNADNQLVSWCLRDQLGSYAALETKPEYRRKGFAKALIQRFNQLLQSTGEQPHAHVLDTNVASRNFFEQLGFRNAGHLYWTVLQQS